MRNVVPYETTPCKFLYLIEINSLNKLFWHNLPRYSADRSQTIVDTAIINAPNSIKNLQNAQIGKQRPAVS